MFGLGPAGGGLPLGGVRDYGYSRERRGARQPYALILGLRLLHTITNLERKPPVTLALMTGMSLFHLKPNFLQDLISIGGVGGGMGNSGGWDWGSWFTGGHVDHVRSVCLYPDAMWETYERTGLFDFKRLLLSAFVHGDDMHLYYNMASFLLKGISLELDMGWQAYAGLLTYCVAASQTLLLMLSWVLMSAFEIRGPMQACTVGFSGVLFALKYILARRSPGVTNVIGFKIHTRYATWLELVLISLLVPNASFLGHLCGILAGVVFVEVPIMLPFLSLLPSVLSGAGAGASRRAHKQSYTYNRGVSGTARPTGGTQDGDGDWVAEDEDFQEAIRRSLQDAAGGRETGGSRGGSGEQDSGVSAGMDAFKTQTYRVAPAAHVPSEDVTADEPGLGRGQDGADDVLGAGELRRRRL